MKKDFAYVAVVLDRSGSMQGVRRATIDGFNEFVNQQKLTPGACRLLLTQFDHEYEIVYDKPLLDVPEMTNETFLPRGSTALFDAMAKTINDLGSKLRAMTEDERPDRVIVLTITDGFENASKEHTQESVKSIIEHQRSQYQWDFVFIGANQDAVLTAQQFGIAAGKALSYNANAASTGGTFAAMSSYTTTTRSAVDAGAVQSVVFTEKNRKDANQ